MSVAIMAHRSREAYIPELVARLDAEPTIAWDQHSDRWETGRRAVLAYDPGATHHLILQDDSVICEDLVSGLELGVGRLPENSPMVLYIGRARPYGPLIRRTVETAGGRGAAWVIMNQILWGPGVVLPTPIIPDVIAWGDRFHRDQNYDRRLSRYFERHNIECWYPWPSLVDHRDGPSLVPGRGGGRTAHAHYEGSALDFDWSGETVHVWDVRNANRTARIERRKALDAARKRKQELHRGKLREP